MYTRPLDHLKKVPVSLDNFRSNVLNRRERPKVDCEKFRSKIFEHFEDSNPKSCDIDKSEVSLRESDTVTGSRVRKQFKPWQHPHGDPS